MKNIIFDFGGVLIKGNAISSLNKFNINEEELNELKRFFSDYEKLDKGKQTLGEKFNECNFSYEISLKYKDLLINYYKYREVNMDLVELIYKLKNRDYKVYVLSNNPHEAFNYYSSNPLFKAIDGFIGSCDYGKVKDDGELFDVILSKYNLDPSECYFIDNKKLNIDMAYKHGIIGYQFDENEDINKLYTDMRNNGIII